MVPIAQQKIGLLEVSVYATRKEMGQAAADLGAARIRELLKERESVNIILGSAPSQLELYAALLTSGLDFGRIHAFHMDEYLGLAPDAPQGFGNYLKEHLFQHVGFRSVHYINGQADNPAAECARYAALLEAYPPDVIFEGIGENGHLAFNDPGVADFHDPARVKISNMDEVCRAQQVHDGCFASLEEVPRQAVTLTIPQLTPPEATLVITVPGPTKAQAVYHTLCGPITEACPASILRRHPHATLVLDRAAAANTGLVKV